MLIAGSGDLQGATILPTIQPVTSGIHDQKRLHRYDAMLFLKTYKHTGISFI